MKHIVLVTGGFDPLHSGHIAYFKEAKKLREQAEELAPTKKRTTAKKTEASAA